MQLKTRRIEIEVILLPPKSPNCKVMPLGDHRRTTESHVNHFKRNLHQRLGGRIPESLLWQRLGIVETACRIPVVDLAKEAMSRLAPTQIVARTLFQVDQLYSRWDVPNLGVEEVTGG